MAKSSEQSSQRHNSGFTLIELLVVVSIIGMLSSVVLASLQSAREKGRIGAGQLFAGHSYRAVGDRLVLHYNFNEADGEDAIDQSGNNLIGALNGNVARVSSYQSGAGSAVSFSSNGQRITTPAFSIPQDVTVSFWINLSNNGTQWIFYYYSVNTSGRLLFEISGSGSNSGRIRVLSGNNYRNYSDGSVNDGKWHHFTYTEKDSTTYTYYIDGKESGGGSLDTNRPELPQTASISYLNAARFFTGSLDDFMIFGETLVASDIQHLYAQGAAERGIAVVD